MSKTFYHKASMILSYFYTIVSWIILVVYKVNSFDKSRVNANMEISRRRIHLFAKRHTPEDKCMSGMKINLK